VKGVRQPFAQKTVDVHLPRKFGARRPLAEQKKSRSNGSSCALAIISSGSLRSKTSRPRPKSGCPRSHWTKIAARESRNWIPADFLRAKNPFPSGIGEISAFSHPRRFLSPTGSWETGFAGGRGFRRATCKKKGARSSGN
jgi:hypothetical protein